jgi:hypothetical protein
MTRGEEPRARDLFDAYLPLVRYESQPGLGLAIRKHTLARRGAIAHPTVRKPGPGLSAAGNRVGAEAGLLQRPEHRVVLGEVRVLAHGAAQAAEHRPGDAGLVEGLVANSATRRAANQGASAR